MRLGGGGFHRVRVDVWKVSGFLRRRLGRYYVRTVTKLPGT